MTEYLFPRSKYRNLLDDEKFSPWIENVARGSKVNAEVTPRGVGRICKFVPDHAGDIATMSK